MVTNKLCHKPVKTKFKKNRDEEYAKMKQQQNRRDKVMQRLLRQEEENEYVVQRQSEE